MFDRRLQCFGRRSGKYAAIEALKSRRPGIAWKQVYEEQDRIVGLLQTNKKGKKGITPADLKRKVQAVLWDDAGALRDKASLLAALDKLKTIRKEYRDIRVRETSGKFNNDLVEAVDVANMLSFGEIMARAALLREETRGGHYREDYPKKDDRKWLKNIVVKKEGSKMRITTMPVVKE